MLRFTLLLLLACQRSSAPVGDSADGGCDSAATGSDSAWAGDDTAPDTSNPSDSGDWECPDVGLLDEHTLCWEHLLHTCDNPAVGLRRGDFLCWPAHAFCSDATPCEGTEEAWVELPLHVPADFRAIAAGVIAQPEQVFESPIDAGFSASRSLLVHSCVEVSDAFYYHEVGPGEEVVLANGTYSDCYISFYADGEEGQPIVLRAENPGGVTLDTCSVYMEGSFLVLRGFDFTGGMLYTPIAMGDSSVPCDYCAVRDVRMDAVVPDSPVNRPYVQVMGYRAEVSDSTFLGKQNTSGVITVDRLQPSDSMEARIYRNYFADRGNVLADPGVTNGFETIRVGWSMDYFYPSFSVIEGNLFERCDGELETLSIKSGSNAVRFNTFRDNAGQVTIRDGFGNAVEGNYVLGEHKSWSGGIRLSGARTAVVNNHVQDLDTQDSVWRYPIALVTGAEDHYEDYTATFEAAVILNRVVSPRHAFALDTGDEYGPVFYPPHDNLYQHNLLFTRGELPVVSYGFEVSLMGNILEDDWTDVDIGTAGFSLHDDVSVANVGHLSRVDAFEQSIAGLCPADLLAGTAMEGALDLLVLGSSGLYEQVPLLVEGDVGAAR